MLKTFCKANNFQIVKGPSIVDVCILNFLISIEPRVMPTSRMYFCCLYVQHKFSLTVETEGMPSLESLMLQHRYKRMLASKTGQTRGINIKSSSCTRIEDNHFRI